MRGSYFAIAGLAAVAALVALRANAIDVGTPTADIGPLGSLIPKSVGGPQGKTVLVGKPFGKTSDPSSPPTLRLAQAGSTRSTGNPSLAPLKWVGMVINLTPTQKNPDADVQCTGQFITPNVVLTAGHCLKDLPDDPTGAGYDLTKQYFVLQYQNGEGSHTYKTKCALASPGWLFPSNYSSMTPAQKDAALRNAAQHDFAMILLDGNSQTGVMHYDLDWKGKWVAATRVGYAGDILNGQIVQQSHGIVFFADSIPMFPSESLPNLVAHWQPITDLTSGTSGGAWIVNFDSTESATNNLLIAVTSFQNTAYPGVEFGAYLTAAEFNPLLAKVQNGCK